MKHKMIAMTKVRVKTLKTFLKNMLLNEDGSEGMWSLTPNLA